MALCTFVTSLHTAINDTLSVAPGVSVDYKTLRFQGNFLNAYGKECRFPPSLKITPTLIGPDGKRITCDPLFGKTTYSFWRCAGLQIPSMSEGEYEYGFVADHTSPRHRPDMRWTFGIGQFNVHPAASPVHTSHPDLNGRAVAATSAAAASSTCASNPTTVTCPSSSDGTCIGGGRLRCSTSIVGTPIGSSVLGSVKACIQACQANKVCVGASMIKSSSICSLYGGTLGNLVTISDSLQDTWLGDSTCPSLCLTASCSTLPSTFSCSNDGTCIGGGRLRCGQLITGTPIGTSVLGNMNACIQACQANAACIGVSMPVIVAPLVTSTCLLFGGTLGNLALTASPGVTNSWLIDSACLSAQCASGASAGSSYMITTQAIAATAALTTFVSGSYIVVGTPSHLQTTAYTTLPVGAAGFTSTISGTAIDQVLIGTASHSQVTSTTTIAAGSVAFITTITGSSIDQVLIGSPSHIQVTVFTTVGSVGFTTTSTGLLTDQVLIGVATHAQLSTYTTVGSIGFTSTITGASIDQVLVGIPTHAQVVSYTTTGSIAFTSTITGASIDQVLIGIPTHAQSSSYTTAGNIAFTSTITGASIDQVLIGVPTHAQTTIYATSGSIGFTSTSTGLSTDQVLIAIPTHAQSTSYTTIGSTAFTSTSIGGLTDQVLIGVPTHRQTTVFTTVGTVGFTSTSTGISIDQVIVGSPSHMTTTLYTTIPSQSPGFTSTSTGVGLTDQVLIGTPSHVQVTVYTTIPTASPVFTSTSIGPGSIDQVLIGTPSHVQVSTTLALPVGALGYTSTSTGTGLTDEVIVALPSHVQVTIVTTIAVGSSGFTSTISGLLTNQVLIGVPSHVQTTSYTTLPSNSAGFTLTSTGSLVDQVLIGIPGNAQSTSYTTIPAGAVGFTSTILGNSVDQVLIGTPSHSLSTSYTTLATGDLGFTSLITGSIVDELLIGTPSHLQTTQYTTLPVGATGFTSTVSALTGLIDEVLIGTASHAQTTARLSLSAGAAAFTSTFSGSSIDEVLIGVPSNYQTTITTTIPSDSSAFISTIIASSGSIDEVLIGSPIKPQTISSTGLSIGSSVVLPVISTGLSSGILAGTAFESLNLPTTTSSPTAATLSLPAITSSSSVGNVTLGLSNAVSSLISSAGASTPVTQSATTNTPASILGASISESPSLPGAPISTIATTLSNNPLTTSNSISASATVTIVDPLTEVSAGNVGGALTVSDNLLTVASSSTTSAIVSSSIQTPTYTTSDSSLLSVSLNGQPMVTPPFTIASSVTSASEVELSSSIQMASLGLSFSSSTQAIIDLSIATSSSLIIVSPSTTLTIMEGSTTDSPSTIVDATTFSLSPLNSVSSSSDMIASITGGSIPSESSSSPATAVSSLSSIITLDPLINTISADIGISISTVPIATSTQITEIISSIGASSAESMMVSVVLPSPDGTISSIQTSANSILSIITSEETSQLDNSGSIVPQIIDSSILQSSVDSIPAASFISSGPDVTPSEPASSSSIVLQILESASVNTNDGSIIIDTLAILTTPSASDVTSSSLTSGLPQPPASVAISATSPITAISATASGNNQITLDTAINTGVLQSDSNSQAIASAIDSAVSPVSIIDIQTGSSSPSVELNTILTSLTVSETATATFLTIPSFTLDLSQTSIGSITSDNAGGSLDIDVSAGLQTSGFSDTLVSGPDITDVATALASAANGDSTTLTSANLDVTTLAVDIAGSATLITLAVVSDTVGDISTLTTAQLPVLSSTSITGDPTQVPTSLSSLTDVVALSAATDVNLGSDSILETIETSASLLVEISTFEASSIIDGVSITTTTPDITGSASLVATISESSVDILGPDSSQVTLTSAAIIIEPATLSSITSIVPSGANVLFTDTAASLTDSSAAIALDGSEVAITGPETSSDGQVSTLIIASGSEDFSLTSVITNISPDVVPLTAAIINGQSTETLVSGSQTLPVIESTISIPAITAEDSTVAIDPSNSSPQPTTIINISEDGTTFPTAIVGGDTVLSTLSLGDTVIILTSDANTNGLVSSVTEQIPSASSSSLLSGSSIIASVLPVPLTTPAIPATGTSESLSFDSDITDIEASTSIQLVDTIIASVVSSSSTISILIATDAPDVASTDLLPASQDDFGSATATYSTIITIAASQVTEITTSDSAVDQLQNSILDSLVSSLLGSDAVVITGTAPNLVSLDSAASTPIAGSLASTTIDINGATAVLVSGSSGFDAVASSLTASTSIIPDAGTTISAFSVQLSDSVSAVIGTSLTLDQSSSSDESLAPFVSLTTVIPDTELASLAASIASETGTLGAVEMSSSSDQLIETIGPLGSNSVTDATGGSDVLAAPSTTATIITEVTVPVETIVDSLSVTQITAIAAGGSTMSDGLLGLSSVSADLGTETSDGSIPAISDGVQLTTIQTSLSSDEDPTTLVPSVSLVVLGTGVATAQPSVTTVSVAESADNSVVTVVSISILSDIFQESSLLVGSENVLTLTTISSSAGDEIVATEVTIPAEVPLATGRTEASESLSVDGVGTAQLDTVTSTGILDSSGIIFTGSSTEGGLLDGSVIVSVAVASATISPGTDILPTSISDTAALIGQISSNSGLTTAISDINAGTSQSTQPSDNAESLDPTLASSGLTTLTQTPTVDLSTDLSDISSTGLQDVQTSTIAIFSPTDGTDVAAAPVTVNEVLTIVEGSSTTLISGAVIPENTQLSGAATTLMVDSSDSTSLLLITGTTISAVVQTGVVAPLPSITVDTATSSIGDTLESSFSSADVLNTVVSDVPSIISIATASEPNTESIIAGSNVVFQTASIIDGGSSSQPESIAQNLQTSLFTTVSQGESGFVSTISGLSTDVVIVGIESDSAVLSSVTEAAGALGGSTQIESDVISTSLNSPSHPHSPPSDFPGYLSTTVQSLSSPVSVLAGSDPVTATNLDGITAATISNDLSVDISAASSQILPVTGTEYSISDLTAVFTSNIPFCIPVTTTVYVTVTVT